ncbi:unnamed protein product [Fasciola hepatica]|uniref:Uncharacterized protein n=1 Tax=Fasciola hepatica TaxID=6192 RepID=A0ABC9HH93_FASHE|nr:unnamed protein product [Fasciola hepatica]
MGLGIGITGFRQRNIPNLRPTVCRLRRNDVKESVENQIFSYNGSWPENGTIQLHACCAKSAEFARNNGLFDFSGTNQRVLCCSQFFTIVCFLSLSI